MSTIVKSELDVKASPELELVVAEELKQKDPKETTLGKILDEQEEKENNHST